MIFYAVIDTNVIVSALLSNHANAATVLLIKRLIDGELIPVYSEEILHEYREVLGRKKFKFDQNMIHYILLTIKKYGVMVNPSATGTVLPDMKDLPFYEVVMEKRGENAHLVTGNLKHFPPAPFIVTPRQMLDILDQKTGIHKK